MTSSSASPTCSRRRQQWLQFTPGSHQCLWKFVLQPGGADSLSTHSNGWCCDVVNTECPCCQSRIRLRQEHYVQGDR
jgi:hypothetical protein